MGGIEKHLRCFSPSECPAPSVLGGSRADGAILQVERPNGQFLTFWRLLELKERTWL
jgi:hypothetical protein